MIIRCILFSSFMVTSLIIFFQYLKATKDQNGVVVATTFTYDQLNDERIRKILQRVRTELKTVLVLSVMINSSILWIPSKESNLIILLVMTVPLLNIMIYALPIARGFYDLRALKASEGWTVGIPKKISVDISLSAKGDRQAISLKYFLIPVTILIAEVFVFIRMDQSGNAFAYIWIGISILISNAAFYSFYRRRKNRAYTKDEKLNEKINGVRKGKTTQAVFWLTLIQTLWYGLCFYRLAIDFYDSNAMILYFLGTLFSYIFAFFYLNSLDERSFRMIPKESAILSDEDEYYDLLGYKNPNDSRIFVEPRIGGKLDINRGHRKGKILFYGSWAMTFLIIIIGLVFLQWMTSATFEVTIANEKIEIEAPMYGLTIRAQDLDSVEWMDHLPEGPIIRTNGYGGYHKSYGKFNIKGVGAVKMYLFTEVSCCICLKAGKEIVYINQSTEAATRELYQRLKE